MNIDCTFYDPTGRYVSSISMPNEEAVQLNTPPGATTIAGWFPEDTYLHDGEVRTIPAKPGSGEYWIFETASGQWVDPRNDEELAIALAQTRRETVVAINLIRGETRTRFITSIPGQDMVYMEKERTARAWMAEFQATGVEPLPDAYPAIAAEIGLTGESAFQVAYIYIYKSEEWRHLSPIIERVSIKYLNLADAAQTVEALDALPAQYQSEMNATLEAVMSQIAASTQGAQA